ncbi:MAG: enolase C-terminal domain-like protein [Limnochordia bacterium]|jgi:L-alanine-DL-glutamate epimerase-like enolase superfamily enzyme
MPTISRVGLNFEREAMSSPFGFKGNALTELWQVVALLENDAGASGIGLGVQSVLWSDAQTFARYPESVGNGMMFLMTAYALEAAKATTFETPIGLLEQLLPKTHAFGCQLTGNPHLPITFALNALVPVDNAAWLLYAQEGGITLFTDLIPKDVRPALAERHSCLACIPLITYGTTIKEVCQLVQGGHFFLKIKVGSDPAKDGDRKKMLEWDKNRLYEIHNAVKDHQTPYTDCGYPVYYLDANGRYDNKERLLQLLDYAEEIEALERIVLFEEPFPEEYKVDVADVPVRLAADESAHSDQDVEEMIQLGYRAIALKPIAKTLSMSLKMTEIAHRHGVPCFCADLTVNPLMVDWNKNVAARLAPLPGVNIGVLESNGPWNYRDWERLKSYHPCFGSSWIENRQGLFMLDDDFYQQSGGIFQPSSHYRGLVGL